MDVTFLESETFFSSSVPNSPRQGEIRNDEPNWLQFDWLSLKDNDINNTEMEVNTEQGTSPETEAETEDPPHSTVPDDPSPGNTPEVNSPTISSNSNDIDVHVGYILPFRHNRGKPPNRYSPDIGERSSKYPIANYVST
jgi:hypothetical protein